VCGIPLIEILLKRLSNSTEIDQIVVATSNDSRNIPLIEKVKNLGFECFCGSEYDVLKRYMDTAEMVGADIIVRITADCPLTDSSIVDEAVRLFKNGGSDYLSNTQPVSFPDGLDVEVFTMETLRKTAITTKEAYDREHVTPYMRTSNCISRGAYVNDIDFSNLRWTVDELSDLNVIDKIISHFKGDLSFSWKDVLGLYKTHPEIFMENQFIARNEGSVLGTGQKLWKRAKKVIPGGNMLLSKRAEMFLPDLWPAYFSEAKGCKVRDLDGNEYIDMSIMGIGTNTLGYGHPEIDCAVTNTIQRGNMSTLNCPEEVYLAEKLVEIHPWADMVKFARSGGEANAVAIRIARAASGRDKVAVCGYHGWHDWYLSANLGSSSELDGHLLPGLQPNGVPKCLRNTVFPFTYNNIEELQQLIDTHEIGVIKMEVARNMGPENSFLHRVREIATTKGIVLIFDECTSGFRETFGGLHKKYGVEPDMAMFGKALGNGYAITAVIGRREIMEAAQSTFISSTFWTERIGPTAALKTLEVMEREKSWEVITNTGLKIRRIWYQIAKEYCVDIEHWGLPALTGFSFKGKNALKYKTLVTQEMLSKGYLASNSVYVCIDHTSDVLDAYFCELSKVFKLIQDCENGLDIDKILRGPICHSGFKRLN
jgi:glutamate-1-semialdehyde 2,1-aminomutase